ncbi:MAG: sugar phosphate nucleotidyltransferase [Candidatus Woesearchaeota archaeon]|mgnify:CR=1|jgi:NDP-sugar pyrophosphorylase family protein|nr:sugar phosphate nucleotidyltransferase [Candidatus Woesearchaeota archaeon]MDP7506587.1 sugar phosphate nucleotidyltransferase [Candidatus Woesearchaeota archaeon]|tara:strand:+ start:2220 stop:2972 length:753 start_codon:yes stop_codon:yes gene_type:complete
MKKVKIAISMDKDLLDDVDGKVDGSFIRSRSQAIELFLGKGLREQSITTAVILIRKDQHNVLLKDVNGKELITRHLEFFKSNGIKEVFIVTQHSPLINDVIDLTKELGIEVRVFEKEAKGNAEALGAIRDKLKKSFVVISGDTYNEFELKKMVKKHLENDKLMTLGLMTREKTAEYGNVVLDGDLVVDFKEKPKESVSNVVNAGIYVFKPEIFSLFDKNTVSLERDLFSKVAGIKQAVGFFTHGEYVHVE